MRFPLWSAGVALAIVAPTSVRADTAADIAALRREIDSLRT